MKKSEYVYRELLFSAIEKGNKNLTQLSLSKYLKISLSTVNNAIKPLIKMNAVNVKLRSLEIIDIKKILYYWASIRNIEKDIIFKTRIDKPVKNIEAEVTSDSVFGAYSAYKYKFKDVPADYSEVYIYSNDVEEIKKRFPENNKTPNLFILKKDDFMKEKTTTIAHTFVDLWNLKEWYAKDFLKALEEKINGILE